MHGEGLVVKSWWNGLDAVGTPWMTLLHFGSWYESSLSERILKIRFL